jgi:hypothetical protein
MESSNQVIRNFSKENNPQERTEIAQQVKEARNAEREFKKNTSEFNENLEHKMSAIESLSHTLENLSGSFGSKIYNALKIRKIKQELGILKKEKDDFVQHDPKQDLTPSDNADTIIENFYREKESEWANLPYEKADIEKYFNKEYLQSLSMEEYVTLMKRFNADFVAHVTRQGVRDHLGIHEHTAGEGKHANGFKGSLQDGEIKHAISLDIADFQKEKEVEKFLIFELSLEDGITKEEAFDRFNRKMDEYNQGKAGSFVDKSSVHFAVESVADAYYGSERGNEIFIAYPSYMIAANYFHESSLHESKSSQTHGRENDVWVYVGQDDDMPIDAGVVFVPKHAQVNPRTGSQYELDNNNDVELETKRVDQILAIIQSKDFDTYIHVMKDLKTNGNYMLEVTPALQDMLANMGVQENDPIFSSITNVEFLRLVQIAKTYEDEDDSQLTSVVIEWLKDEGLYYKKSSEAVSSEEYWETYFKETGKRPSKIVYYTESNPTGALYAWRHRMGLNLTSQPLEVDDKRVKRTYGSELTLPDQMSDELKRFKSIGEKVLNDYFEKNTNHGQPTSTPPPLQVTHSH